MADGDGPERLNRSSMDADTQETPLRPRREPTPSMTPPPATVTTLPAAPAAPARREAVGTQRRHNEGHGRRLT